MNQQHGVLWSRPSEATQLPVIFHSAELVSIKICEGSEILPYLQAIMRLMIPEWGTKDFMIHGTTGSRSVMFALVPLAPQVPWGNVHVVGLSSIWGTLSLGNSNLLSWVVSKPVQTWPQREILSLLYWTVNKHVLLSAGDTSSTL